MFSVPGMSLVWADPVSAHPFPFARYSSSLPPYHVIQVSWMVSRETILFLGSPLSICSLLPSAWNTGIKMWCLRLWWPRGNKADKKTEKAMAPHCSTLAWKIPWTEEPGRLESMGSRRVGHDWATSLSLFTFMHWRRKWQPTPVFFPGESPGRGSLVGCRLWGCTESDTTEVT